MPSKPPESRELVIIELALQFAHWNASYAPAERERWSYYIQELDTRLRIYLR